MSLAISCYVPTGIVISAESRTTMTWRDQPAPAGPVTVTNVILSDATHKLFLLFGRFGVATFGDAFISDMPIAHCVSDFEVRSLATAPSSTEACARALLGHFAGMSPKPAVSFLVAGYDGLMPYSFAVNVSTDEVRRQNVAADGTTIQYGVGYGGDTAVIGRLLGDPKFLPAFQVMPLQDAVDFTRHLVRTTVEQMRFEPRFATVGGPIDTLVLEPSKNTWLSQKSLVARGGA